MFTEFAHNLWSICLEAAPWLLLGLVAAGLVKAYLPDRILHRWLGGRGTGSVARAALIGAPLPLCSCGVLPAAMGLHRQGASKGATVSFLVATPETGVDSVVVSYALLGPFMAILRPIAAIFSAVVAGLLTDMRVARGFSTVSREAGPVSDMSCCADSGCAKGDGQGPEADGERDLGCDKPESASRLVQGWRYAVTDLLDDLSGWMAVGVVLAAVVSTFVPPDTLTTWGSGLPTMLAMVAVGVPIYICATASTPLAAAMLHAGMSPGTVLVFLLAGPATNLATLALVRRELGTGTLITYLTAICFCAVAFGLLTDFLAGVLAVDVAAEALHGGEFLPPWLSVASLGVLVVFSIRPLRRLILR